MCSGPTKSWNIHHSHHIHHKKIKRTTKRTCLPRPTKTLELALQLKQVCSLVLFFLQFGVSFLFSTNLFLLLTLNRLTEAARSGVINPADLAGGSITISNIGVIGGTAAMPIINKPEVAIVALGKIQKLPRFDANNNVVSRSILTVSWSGDHRVIDGGTIARFNKLWRQYLEQPQTMLLAMLEL